MDSGREWATAGVALAARGSWQEVISRSLACGRLQPPPCSSAWQPLSPRHPTGVMALDMQQPKVRKPYVIQKSRELWSDEEHELFEQLLKS